MYKWEDEKWEKVNLQAGYSRNDRRCMETYLCVPAQRGKFHVYIEADGEFVVKHIGGDLDGSWLGNIAYDVGQRTWSVGNYKGCKITNFQTNTTFVAGHPDAEMNHKSFDSARAVEVDWFASFELSCDDDEGSWRIFPPPIQKDSSYNYTVSYANYTEKYCEWGAISISIDEDNENGSMPIRKPLKGEMQWSQPEEEDLLESQRQDYNTPADEKAVSVSWAEDQSSVSELEEDSYEYWVDRAVNLPDDYECRDFNGNLVRLSDYNVEDRIAILQCNQDIYKRKVGLTVGARERLKLAGVQPKPSDRTEKIFTPSFALREGFRSVDPSEYLNRPEEFGVTTSQATEFINRTREFGSSEDPMAKLERELDEVKPPSPPSEPNWLPNEDPWEGVKITPKALRSSDQRSTLSTGTLKRGALSRFGRKPK